MQEMAHRERDLEMGGAMSELDATIDPLVSSNGQTRFESSSLSNGYPGVLLDQNGSCEGRSFNVEASEGVELLIDTSPIGVESVQKLKESPPVVTKCVQGNCKKPNSKRHPKPPRPPKGPMLNAADQKLVREIAVLALEKRARIERMKALRKWKAPRGSSSSSSLSAIITLIFCLVIIFQGISPRSRPTDEFQGSSEGAVSSRDSSIHYYETHPTLESQQPSSRSLNFIRNRFMRSKFYPTKESKAPFRRKRKNKALFKDPKKEIKLQYY